MQSHLILILFSSDLLESSYKYQIIIEANVKLLELCFYKTKYNFLNTMSPMCNTFLERLGVAHWVQPVYFEYIKNTDFSWIEPLLELKVRTFNHCGNLKNIEFPTTFSETSWQRHQVNIIISFWISSLIAQFSQQHFA